MQSIENKLADFLQLHLNEKKTVLLGLSGGPDSLLLFHLLIKIKSQFPFQLGIAHVDHGWRKESAAEAVILSKLAKEHQIPFHLKKLHPNQMKGNLEAACREARFSFFKELCQEFEYQAVLLGHHAGDLVETVFKRILEGVALPYICGLNEITVIDNLTVWRPLLPFHKSEIWEAIRSYSLVPFEDITNKDPKYLRGRMRTQIFPELSLQFGKEIDTSLERIGTESRELREYLLVRLEKELESIECGPLGLFLDFNLFPSLHPYELKFLVRKFCEKGDFFLSRDFLETTVELIQKRTANKEIKMGPHQLLIDRGRLFHLKKKIELPQTACEIKSGEFIYGPWQFRVEEISDCHKIKLSNWVDAWKGFCEVCVPQGNYYLGTAIPSNHYPGSSPLSKWWTDAKVPAFFRQTLPVIWSDNRVCAEFLTGRKNDQQKSHLPGLRIMGCIRS